MSEPLYIALGLGIGVVLLLGYIVLLCRQYLEIRRLRNGLTFYRWIIFIIYLSTVLMLPCILMYRMLRIQGIESVVLANIASVGTPFVSLLTLVLLFIFTFGKINLEEDK